MRPSQTFMVESSELTPHFTKVEGLPKPVPPGIERLQIGINGEHLASVSYQTCCCRHDYSRPGETCTILATTFTIGKPWRQIATARPLVGELIAYIAQNVPEPEHV